MNHATLIYLLALDIMSGSAIETCVGISVHMIFILRKLLLRTKKAEGGNFNDIYCWINTIITETLNVFLSRLFNEAVSNETI
jgi:hypothetical protein